MRLTFRFDRIRPVLLVIGAIPLEDHPPDDLVENLMIRCKSGECVSVSAFKLLYKEACPHCEPRDEITLELLCRAAELLGGECKSPAYLGYNVAHSWCCDCGYEWNTTPKRVLQGKWCPKCAIAARKNKLSDVVEFADSIGVECASRAYDNNHEEMPWKCKKTRVDWSESFNRLARRGSCRCCRD